MARRRTTPKSAGPLNPGNRTVRLCLDDPQHIDWSHSAEGPLVVYDPAVVTEEVLTDIAGLELLTNDVLWWLAGRPRESVGRQFPNWGSDAEAGTRPAEVSRRVGLLARLAWDRALMVLDARITWGGAAVRFTGAGLSAEERRQQKFEKRSPTWPRTHYEWPLTGGIAVRGPRLGATWGFILGMSPQITREHFGPGYRVEFPWPPGEYQARAWCDFQEEDGSDADGDKVVIQLTRVPPPPEPTADKRPVPRRTR